MKLRFKSNNKHAREVEAAIQEPRQTAERKMEATRAKLNGENNYTPRIDGNIRFTVSHMWMQDEMPERKNYSSLLY